MGERGWRVERRDGASVMAGMQEREGSGRTVWREGTGNRSQLH